MNQSVETSLEGVFIPTPDQRTKKEEVEQQTEPKKYKEVSMSFPGLSIPKEWLNSKMVSCGKAVGISVRNGEKGWDNLIQFAQQREASHNAAKAGGNVRKKWPENSKV
eukprot:TRINITY_DN38314_c1_g1_i1.p2 TRINITY_DN38314_c1_g1~~TRINITY_DN38314_c1_g1_i1.p2  ORF type:complete len:108 (+),score=16.94 TRINITY_DN38314_c1_g1_i1:87-410(+)